MMFKSLQLGKKEQTQISQKTSFLKKQFCKQEKSMIQLLFLDSKVDLKLLQTTVENSVAVLSPPQSLPLLALGTTIVTN